MTKITFIYLPHEICAAAKATIPSNISTQTNPSWNPPFSSVLGLKPPFQYCNPKPKTHRNPSTNHHHQTPIFKNTVTNNPPSSPANTPNKTNPVPQTTESPPRICLQNPRHHRLRSVALPPNEEEKGISNHKLLFILFNGCLTFLVETLFNRPLGYINKEISN